jgi:hypothetical protein
MPRLQPVAISRIAAEARVRVLPAGKRSKVPETLRLDKAKDHHPLQSGSDPAAAGSTSP